jgi:hypothetical protein
LPADRGLPSRAYGGDFGCRKTGGPPILAEKILHLLDLAGVAARSEDSSPATDTWAQCPIKEATLTRAFVPTAQILREALPFPFNRIF